MNRSVLILGSGYTGRFLTEALLQESRDFLATSRSPEQHLSHLSADKRLRFELGQSDTWKHVPAHADILWCFPATPLESVHSFAAAASLRTRRVVVLGSTSAYDVGGSDEYPPPWIDERAPIDLTRPRVQGEEFLRQECGAIVLRVAGIYGPGRNPLDWIRSGRVGSSRKYVNLIHVDDLAAICLAALDRGTAGEAYNVSDGTPHTWEDICALAQVRWKITPRAESVPESAGKRLATVKLIRHLQTSIQHPDLQAELARLEGGTADL